MISNPLASPFAKPGPWLGAYYTLRENDPVAMKNREQKKDKAAPTRGRFIVAEMGRREIAAAQAIDPWRDSARFQRGDILEVEYRPQDAPEAEITERVVGLCIAVHRRGIGSSFRLLCKPDDVPVEYQFQLFAPTLRSIELRQRPTKAPRMQKIYYMRERVGELKFLKPSVGPGSPKPKRGDK